MIEKTAYYPRYPFIFKPDYSEKFVENIKMVGISISETKLNNELFELIGISFEPIRLMRLCRFLKEKRITADGIVKLASHSNNDFFYELIDPNAKTAVLESIFNQSMT